MALLRTNSDVHAGHFSSFLASGLNPVTAAHSKSGYGEEPGPSDAAERAEHVSANPAAYGQVRSNWRFAPLTTSGKQGMHEGDWETAGHLSCYKFCSSEVFPRRIRAASYVI